MDENLTLDVGFKFFASGLACGLSGLVSSIFNALGCRLCDWVCGRLRSASARTTTSNLRGNDPDADLRGSNRTVRPYSGYYFESGLMNSKYA